MTKITFHCAQRDVAVWGVEYHHAIQLCRNAFIAALGLSDTMWMDGELRAIWEQFLPPEGNHLRRSDPFPLHLATYLRVGEPLVFPRDGTAIDTSQAALNTLVCIGNDVSCLIAHIAGQCEIHGYIEEANRAWIADLIEEGLEQNVLRRTLRGHPNGWENVIMLLRGTEPGPIVTSYSVEEAFPNPQAAQWQEGDDAWYRLSDEQAWSLGMAGLRNGSMGNVEWQPATWHDGFGSGVHGYDIAAEIASFLKP